MSMAVAISTMLQNSTGIAQDALEGNASGAQASSGQLSNNGGLPQAPDPCPI
jgi:hypothetical protein